MEISVAQASNGCSQCVNRMMRPSDAVDLESPLFGFEWCSKSS